MLLPAPQQPVVIEEMHFVVIPLVRQTEREREREREREASENKKKLGGGFKYFFSSLLGEDSRFE